MCDKSFHVAQGMPQQPGQAGGVQQIIKTHWPKTQTEQGFNITGRECGRLDGL